MFVILALDGNEYGPVDAERLKGWVVARRADARTQARRSNETEWHTLGDFAEFGEVLASVAGAPSGLPPRFVYAGTPVVERAQGTIFVPDEGAFADELASRSRRLSVRSCIGRARTLCRNCFGSLLGAYLLLFGFIIAAGISLAVLEAAQEGASSIGSFVLTPVIAILQGGLIYFYINRARGVPLDMGAVFSGFKRLPLQLILLSLVRNLFSLIASIPLIALSFFVGRALSATEILANPRFKEEMEKIPPQFLEFIGSLETLSWVTFAVLYALLLLSFFGLFWLTLSWSFAEYLIMDKRLHFWTAMGVSRRVVGRQFWKLLLLLIAAMLLNMLGALCLLVGLFYTVPLTLAALAYAYEDLFCGENQG
ncbi:MAG: DUF4339 domain-containing protein [Puniceicoccales bacterium]|jgi:hypothetical protein|nr:DUF4339 domain-containing protein [Puniceicoccales bacterium]